MEPEGKTLGGVALDDRLAETDVVFASEPQCSSEKVAV
jgi:hypothetical protein